MVSAYTIAFAAFILTAGALGDRIGAKRVFMAGFALFTAASAGCGLAPDALTLIVARAVQGLGAAILVPNSLALLSHAYPDDKARGRAVGIWAAGASLTLTAGPLVGGSLIALAGWRWIFFVNLPIGVAVIALSATKIANVRDPEARHTDVLGLVTFAGALSLLVFALLRGNSGGWTSATILGPLVGSVLFVVVFAVVERRQERPMFDLSLFRQRAFVGVSFGTFAIGAGMFGLVGRNVARDAVD